MKPQAKEAGPTGWRVFSQGPTEANRRLPARPGAREAFVPSPGKRYRALTRG